MKSKLITRKILNKAYPKVPTHYGRPNTKYLSNWIYKLDLDRFNIIVRETIDCLNFVIEHMVYYDDQVTHKSAEHWLQSPDEVYDWILHQRKGDCDDAAITLASILHSIGDDRVRLALGYYGDPRYADTSKVQMNHAYCLLQTGDNDYQLIDAVGDQASHKIDNTDKHPEYITMVSASADGRMWLHGPWVDLFG